MIKMTEDLFEKFSNCQEELDANIRETKEINMEDWMNELDINHELALKGEIAEFINEDHEAWKYWKNKKNRPDDMIDEAVDIIHFMHLLLNKKLIPEYRDERLRTYVKFINDQVESFKPLKIPIKKHLYYMYRTESLENKLVTYARLLHVLGEYNFTLNDIEKAYDKKHKENYRRQATGY